MRCHIVWCAMPCITFRVASCKGLSDVCHVVRHVHGERADVGLSGTGSTGHSLVRGPTKRVPPPLVARVTRPERALSLGAAEQGAHCADYRRFIQDGN